MAYFLIYQSIFDNDFEIFRLGENIGIDYIQQGNCKSLM